MQKGIFYRAIKERVIFNIGPKVVFVTDLYSIKLDVLDEYHNELVKKLASLTGVSLLRPTAKGAEIDLLNYQISVIEFVVTDRLKDISAKEAAKEESIRKEKAARELKRREDNQFKELKRIVKGKS